MNLHRCDECRREDDSDVLNGWLVLERLEGRTGMAYSMGEPIGPWHFCGTACLALWAGRHSGGGS